MIKAPPHSTPSLPTPKHCSDSYAHGKDSSVGGVGPSCHKLGVVVATQHTMRQRKPDFGFLKKKKEKICM